MLFSPRLAREESRGESFTNKRTNRSPNAANTRKSKTNASETNGSSLCVYINISSYKYWKNETDAIQLRTHVYGRRRRREFFHSRRRKRKYIRNYALIVVSSCREVRLFVEIKRKKKSINIRRQFSTFTYVGAAKKNAYQKPKNRSRNCRNSETFAFVSRIYSGGSLHSFRRLFVIVSVIRKCRTRRFVNFASFYSKYFGQTDDVFRSNDKYKTRTVNRFSRFDKTARIVWNAVVRTVSASGRDRRRSNA